VLGAQAIQVGVVQRELARRMAVHQVEGGRGDVVGDAHAPPEPLGERGLARTHLARQHHHVTAAHQARHGFRDGLRGGER
jgi:hypothetical protein